jgi:hypothetical protein
VWNDECADCCELASEREARAERRMDLDDVEAIVSQDQQVEVAQALARVISSPDVKQLPSHSNAGLEERAIAAWLPRTAQPSKRSVLGRGGAVLRRNGHDPVRAAPADHCECQRDDDSDDADDPQGQSHVATFSRSRPSRAQRRSLHERPASSHGEAPAGSLLDAPHGRRRNRPSSTGHNPVVRMREPSAFLSSPLGSRLPQQFTGLYGRVGGSRRTPSGDHPDG